MDNVVIAGSGGMLGSAFAQALGDNASLLGRDVLAPLNVEAISSAISESKARLVINCAAHTDVESAESAPEEAWKVNGLLPGVLGDACRRAGAILVHFSSTGAYGDWKDTPYIEEDPLKPTTVHHRSKAAGEVAVRDSGCEHLIVRTGWLFGGAPGQSKNFVWKRLVEAATRESMTSDATQWGNPTATTDVVTQVFATLQAGYLGTVNIVSQGQATRYDYVRRIVAAAGLVCEVMPSVVPFRRAAPVSSREAAVNRRLQLLNLDMMPNWHEAVDRYVEELKATSQWAMMTGITEVRT